MSFKLASDLKTRQTVWITVKNGIQLELDPIQVCSHYRQKYASDVKKVTVWQVAQGGLRSPTRPIKINKSTANDQWKSTLW
jgi:hypothetical protein